MPLGYLVPAAMTEVVDLLKLHGVEMERTAKPLEASSKPIASATSNSPGEQRGPRRGELRREAGEGKDDDARRDLVGAAEAASRAPDLFHARAAGAGFAGALGPDESVFETGFGGGVGEYLSEPIARRMMADHPELRKQFEAKLAADPQFAADARARLQWWFQQSKYEPSDANRYPIVRAWVRR